MHFFMQDEIIYPLLNDLVRFLIHQFFKMSQFGSMKRVPSFDIRYSNFLHAAIFNNQFSFVFPVLTSTVNMNRLVFI